MRRPFVGIASCVVFGMVLGSLQLISLGALFLVTTLCLVLAIIAFSFWNTHAWMFLALVLLSACRFMVSVETSTTATVQRLEMDLPLEQIELVGRISAEPKFYPYPSDNRGSWNFPLKCERLGVKENWKKLYGHIRVRINGAGPNDHFQFGQRLHVVGELQKRNFPGGESFQLTAREQEWRLLEQAPRFSLTGWGQQLRKHAAEHLSSGIGNHSTQLAVFKALLLGYRKAIPHDIYNQFRRTGTVHIFAISGLHVGMVGFLIVVVLKALGVPYRRWGLLLLPLLFFYVSSTGMKSSALRAFTMAAVYFIAPLIRRKPDIPTSVAVAAVLLLWIKPSEIQSIGFILSFTVVSFIIMVFSIIPKGWIYKGRGWKHAAWNYFASLIVTSVAAGIASAPLIALYFGTYSPVALMGNLFVVPLTFGIVISGWLSMLLPFASELFNHAALVFINGMLGTVGSLSRLPGACLNVPIPPMVSILIWYVGWIWFFTHARSTRQRFASLGFALFAIFFAVLPVLVSQ